MDLNLGQKDCRLPNPSSARRRCVRPKIEALQWVVKDGMQVHTYSQHGLEDDPNDSDETMLLWSKE